MRGIHRSQCMIYDHNPWFAADSAKHGRFVLIVMERRLHGASAQSAPPKRAESDFLCVNSLE